jgi:hypothetical protein
MRSYALVSALTAAACLSGCATRKAVVSQCAGPSSDQTYNAVLGSVDKAFGKRRLGYHVLQNDLASDANGNIVLNLTRIGPATEEQPGPGQGKRLTVVMQPCTGKVLRFYQP